MTRKNPQTIIFDENNTKGTLSLPYGHLLITFGVNDTYESIPVSPRKISKLEERDDIPVAYESKDDLVRKLVNVLLKIEDFTLEEETRGALYAIGFDPQEKYVINKARGSNHENPSSDMINIVTTVDNLNKTSQLIYNARTFVTIFPYIQEDLEKLLQKFLYYESNY